MLKTEKKVEYLELIYDLIFVYIIGRNNTLLHEIENGFVDWKTFLLYLTCGLAIIQIWSFTTFYTNLYGRNSVRDHIFIFLNMYFLYYIANGMGQGYGDRYEQYYAAWALILINIGVQYIIEFRKHKDSIGDRRIIKGLMIGLFGEAFLVLASIPIHRLTGVSVSLVAILYGIVSIWALTNNKTKENLVDFTHLTERAMLYVVFTFGEMIIIIAPYFEREITANSVYFSTMGFLMVVGLFLCYEMLYDHIIDRETSKGSMLYMFLHIFLILGLNLITASLEFMRNEEVALMPKTIFLIVSFLLTFACMFLLLRFAKPEMQRCRKLIIRVIITSVIFAVLMILLRANMYLNILLSAVYIYSQYLLLYMFKNQRRIGK